MKILYTATVLSHICQFHLPYLKSLQENGHCIHVAAHDNLSVKNGLSLKYTDRFIETPFQRSPKSPDNIKAYKQLKSLIAEEKYDIIVCNTPMGGVVTRLAAKAARKKGTKVIYIAHGFHFFKGAAKSAWMVYYPIEKILAKYCDVVVTINEEDYQLAKERFPVRVEHICGIGVDPNRYHPVSESEKMLLREKENLSEHDFVILCTGELNRNKNQKTLIEAASLLQGIIPNLKVLLAGNGPNEPALHAQITALHLEDSVRLLGYRTDLENLVPAVDLIVSCSYREGLPMNIIEGMLCQKPVVASVNRGHVELVEDGVNGYLVQADDSKAFADRINKLFTDRELAKRFGDSGYRKAENYTVSAVSGTIEQILNI